MKSLALSPESALLFLQRFVDDVRQRGVTIEDVDVEPFVLQCSHRVEAFLFTRPSASDPNLDALHFAVAFCLAKSVDDAAKGLFHIREVRNCATNNDVLNTGQRTHFLRENFHSPIGWIAGVFGIIRQLPTSRHDRIRVVHAGPHRREAWPCLHQESQ